MKFKRKKQLFVLLIIIILSSVLLYRLNIFAVKSIGIQSENIPCTDNNQIKDAAGLEGKNFFLINSSKTENSLKKKFICIKSVAISKYFPNKVSLHILGRQPFAVLVGFGDVYIADDENMVFSKETDRLNLPKIYVPDLKVSLGQKLEGRLAGALAILSKLKTLKIEANTSRIDGDFFIVDPTEKIPGIIFRINEKIDIQLASLQLILAEAKIDLTELEFIDLRYDKPIVRFAPKEHGKR